MQKHFAKKQTYKKMPSQLHSAVFNALPWGKLVCEEELAMTVKKGIDGEYCSVRESDILNLVKDLAKEGFVGEFPGVKLERLLELN